MRALVKRGVLESVERSLGVGKVTDEFVVTPSERLYDKVPNTERAAPYRNEAARFAT